MLPLLFCVAEVQHNASPAAEFLATLLPKMDVETILQNAMPSFEDVAGGQQQKAPAATPGQLGAIEDVQAAPAAEKVPETVPVEVPATVSVEVPATVPVEVPETVPAAAGELTEKIDTELEAKKQDEKDKKDAKEAENEKITEEPKGTELFGNHATDAEQALVDEIDQADKVSVASNAETCQEDATADSSTKPTQVKKVKKDPKIKEPKEAKVAKEKGHEKAKDKKDKKRKADKAEEGQGPCIRSTVFCFMFFYCLDLICLDFPCHNQSKHRNRM